MTSDGDGRDPAGSGSEAGGIGRPGWLLPAAGGLVAGLVIALGAVALFGGDDADAPVVTTTIPTTTTIPG